MRELERNSDIVISVEDDIIKDLLIDIQPGDEKVNNESNFVIKHYNSVMSAVLKPISEEMLLHRSMLQEYFCVSVFQTFMIIPQTCIVLR